MKKRTSNVSRRIVSLLMSMVLTLTLVTPAAFATEVVGGSGTTIIAGNANPADANPSGDNEGKDDENKDTEHGGDEQPTNPGDEDKNPGEGEDDVNASSNEADTQEGEGTDTPVVAQRTVTLEKWNKNAAYDVKIVIPAATSEPGEGETTEAPGEGENAGSGEETLSNEYTGTAEKITLKLTTADYADEAIYVKSSMDEAVAENTTKLGNDGTLEYVFTGEETDITLYYGTKDDFVSAWYGDGSATEYTIRTAEELAYLAQVVNGTLVDKNGSSIAPNTFSGKSIALARDIDLSAVCHPADEENGIDEASWTPIGDGSEIWDWSIYPPLITCSFEGEFDGQGHTVSKLHAVQGQTQYVGLFGYVVDGTIKNLVVSGAVSGDEDAFGGSIVGCADGGIIKGCVNKANVESGYAGGIVGKIGNAGTVVECQNIGEVKGNKAGGIAGAIESYIPEQVEITNCLNTGAAIASSMQSVNAEAYAGGIVGLVQQDDGDEQSTTLNSCRNEGEVTVTVPGTGSMLYAGGIAGYGISIKEGKNLSNTGNVTNESGTAAGLVAFINDKGSVTNSYNHGNVTGAEGKVFGLCEKNVTNSYYICKLNDADDVAMKYVLNNIEQPVTYEEATQSYKVGENTLVKTLNDNKAANGLKWFVNIPKGITKPIFIELWDGTDHPDYVPDGTEKEVHVTYDPNDGSGGRTVAVTVTLNEDGTVKTPGSHTILTVEAAGIEKDNNEFKDWNTAADGSGTSYDPNDVISVSEDLTLYAQWQPLWKGSGTESDPYQIENEADWLKMQKYAGKYKYYRGAWFALMNDITLDSSYEPFTFAGNLKGNHHAITVNIPKTTENGKHSRGLFDSLAGGTDGLLIENLTIAGSVTAFQYAGGLAGSASSKVTLENVTNTATVHAEGLGNAAAGGLIGTYNGGGMYPLTVKNCTNSGTVIADRAVRDNQAAGFVATMNSSADMSFSGCRNAGVITGKDYAAGFVSIHNAYNLTCTFENCANSGTISANARAAGIAICCGLAANCTNRGTISGDIAAGILGTGGAVRCTNTGTINGTACAAGIVANFNGVGKNIVTSFCANFGKVTATAGSGAAKPAYGIASQGTIKNCFTYNNETHVPVAGDTTGRNCVVTNSYYLASSATEFPSTMGGTPATLDDFASGKVAWGVDGGTGAHVGWWTQDTTKGYPKLLPAADKAQSYYRAQATCGTGGAVTLDSSLGYTSTKDADNAVYGPAGTSVTIKATPKDNTFGLKSLTWTHNGQTDVLPTKGTTNIVMPAESNVTIRAEFASVGGGGGGYYYGGSGDGTGTGDKDDEGLQDGLNMDVEYNIKGLVLGAYAEWGSNGGNKSFQKWLEENPNVVRALLTNSLDNMATAAVGKKTDEAKDLAALLLASLNEHTGVDGKNGDTIAKALQKYIDSGSEEVFSAWLTGGGGMASGTYESIYGQYASSLAALADRLYSKWEASGTSMTFPVWLDSQQVSMDSLSENADEPDTDSTNDPQTSDAPDDVPDGQDTEGGASGNSVWEIIGTVVRENPILVWSIVAVIAALIIVGAVRRYHKVKRDEHDEK